MERSPKSDEAESGQPNAAKRPFPKRGAFPTPQAEIEKATPYVIETDGSAEEEPPSPEKSGSRG